MGIALILGFSSMRDEEVINVLNAEELRYKKIFGRGDIPAAEHCVYKIFFDLKNVPCINASETIADSFDSRIAWYFENSIRGNYFVWISQINEALDRLTPNSRSIPADDPKKHYLHTNRLVLVFHSSTLTRMPSTIATGLLALTAMSHRHGHGLWKIIILSCGAGYEQTIDARAGQGSWWSQRFLEDMSMMWCFAAINRGLLKQLTFNESRLKNEIPVELEEKIATNLVNYVVKAYAGYISTDLAGHRAANGGLTRRAGPESLAQARQSRRIAIGLKKVGQARTKRTVVDWKVYTDDGYDSDADLLEIDPTPSQAIAAIPADRQPPPAAPRGAMSSDLGQIRFFNFLNEKIMEHCSKKSFLLMFFPALDGDKLTSLTFSLAIKAEPSTDSPTLTFHRDYSPAIEIQRLPTDSLFDFKHRFCVQFTDKIRSTSDIPEDSKKFFIDGISKWSPPRT